MHGAVVFGKRLTEAYYGRGITYSYFAGCSTGGRNGLKEIQISPDSFDGALIGAPAWWSSHLNPWLGRIGASNLPLDAPHHIDVEEFELLAREALRQCDAVDGVEDGIIAWPEECRLDLSRIQCPGNVARPGCLLAEQIATARGIYEDARDAAGNYLHPGFTVGSEDQWKVFLAFGAPADFDQRYPKYWLYNDSTWDWTRFNDSVFADSFRLDPGRATADRYDVSPYAARGGKVLLYHGLADALVPTRGSALYHARTREAMGGDAALDDWFRRFEVPGMAHCYGVPATAGAGNAPWYFAAASQATYALNTLGLGEGWGVPNQTATAGNDALLALMRWVEGGTAPERLVATSWDGGGEVDKTRPICAWPKRPTYVGSGDKNREESWECR
jgi:feruloyl esterase